MSKNERKPPKFTKSVVIETSQPELFLSRELATLEFNFRVLAQARDPSIPLLERLRYLSIVANNLDEFFEVRVGLKTLFREAIRERKSKKETEF